MYIILYLYFSNLEEDVKRLEANIKKQIELKEAAAAGLDSDTCKICNKVKFAGNAGYICHYCQLKSCSRCGGRLLIKAKVGQLNRPSLFTKSCESVYICPFHGSIIMILRASQ